jgi:hypothetical protein
MLMFRFGVNLDVNRAILVHIRENLINYSIYRHITGPETDIGCINFNFCRFTSDPNLTTSNRSRSSSN